MVISLWVVQLLDLLVLKYITNWSSVGSVHDGIVPSLSVSCQMSMRSDDDLWCLEVNSLHSPGIFNDRQSNYLPGGS